MQVNDITGQVIDAAIKVHTVLGPGLLESAYEVCLAHELRKRGLNVQTQVLLPIDYEGLQLEAGYRPISAILRVFRGSSLSQAFWKGF